MNSTEYRKARHTEYRAVIDTCYPIATGLVTATTEERKAAIHACNFASDKWAVDQKHANTMAQAELDAATAKGCEEVVEEPAAEVATATLDTSEVFGTAWGADGQVLSYEETVEAIAKRDGWFDREGRWVNKAGWEKKHAGLGAWLTAKLAE